MEENTLLIIGNGFDLNFGLKTSYSDFLNSEEFEMKRYESLSKYLRQKKYLHNWVDIEVELANYCKVIYKLKVRESKIRLKEELRRDYNDLKSGLKKYLSKLEVPTLDIHTDNYALNLVQDLCEWQNSSLDTISFNYTETLERIQKAKPLPPIDVRVYHIHGSLRTDIVFGVDDGADLEREEVYLYKSYSQYKNTRALNMLLNQYTNVVFFGYSMGWTDRQYFQPFFNYLTKDNGDEHNITFYYYGTNAYDNLKYELQLFTAHQLSTLEINHNVEYIDCQKAYQKPGFIKRRKNDLNIL